MKYSIVICLSLLFTHPAFGAVTGQSAVSAEPVRENIEYLPWSVNLGMSNWTMGPRSYDKYRAFSGQFGYRFNRTLGAELETTYGRATYESGYSSETLRRDIYSLALILTPVSISLYGWNFFEIGIVTGGSYFDYIDYTVGYVAGRVGMALNPNFALIGQYRKYIGMPEVAGSRYDSQSVNPEDFTTFAVSMRF